MADADVTVSEVVADAVVSVVSEETVSEIFPVSSVDVEVSVSVVVVSEVVVTVVSVVSVVTEPSFTVMVRTTSGQSAKETCRVCSPAASVSR